MERASMSSYAHNRAKRYARRYRNRLVALCAVVLFLLTINYTAYHAMSWWTALESKTQDQTKRMEALIMRQSELDVRMQMLERKLESVSETSSANALQDSIYQVEKKVNALEPLLTYVASLLQQSLQAEVSPTATANRVPLVSQNSGSLRKPRQASRFETESANLLAGGNDPSIDMLLSQVASKKLRGASSRASVLRQSSAPIDSAFKETSFGSLSADLLVAGSPLSMKNTKQIGSFQQGETNGIAPEKSQTWNEVPPTVNEIDASMMPNYRKIQDYLATHPAPGEVSGKGDVTASDTILDHGILKE